jgi:hypothetical protein
MLKIEKCSSHTSISTFILNQMRDKDIDEYGSLKIINVHPSRSLQRKNKSKSC